MENVDHGDAKLFPNTYMQGFHVSVPSGRSQKVSSIQPLIWCAIIIRQRADAGMRVVATCQHEICLSRHVSRAFAREYGNASLPQIDATMPVGILGRAGYER